MKPNCGRQSVIICCHTSTSKVAIEKAEIIRHQRDAKEFDDGCRSIESFANFMALHSMESGCFSVVTGALNN